MSAERRNSYNPFVDQAVLRIQEREAKEREWRTVCSGPARTRLQLCDQQREDLNRDACEACYGVKGGVPGNESVIDGRVLCDYCSIAFHTQEQELAELLQIAVTQRWLFSGFRIQARKLGAEDEEIRRLWLTRTGS